MIQHRYRRARGFTLIELLVVIGVILVLVGIASYAFSRLDPTERATRLNLENARGMLSELEAFAGYAEIKRINTTTDPTNELYKALKRVPANQSAMAKLGPKAIRNVNGVPRLLDGWGNDIKYFPSQVSVNVARKPDGSYDTANQGRIIKSPDGRPFFMSAGPDGKDVDGDDNIYSFQL